MNKIFYLISLTLLFLGCASAPEIYSSNNESYQRLINAREIECVFTRGAFFILDDEIVVNPVSYDLPWTMTSTTDRASEEVTIYSEDSTGHGETYSDFLRKKWNGGLSFIRIWASLGGVGIYHISIFDSDEAKTNNYRSLLSAYYSYNNTGTYAVSGECRVVQ